MQIPSFWGPRPWLVLAVGGGEKAATAWAPQRGTGGRGFPGFQSACPLEADPASQDLLAPAAHLVIPFMLPRNIYQAQIRVPGSGVQGGGGRGHLWPSWWGRGRQESSVMTQPSALPGNRESGSQGLAEDFSGVCSNAN